MYFKIIYFLLRFDINRLFLQYYCFIAGHEIRVNTKLHTKHVLHLPQPLFCRS
jgi:hypothetical protein